MQKFKLLSVIIMLALSLTGCGEDDHQQLKIKAVSSENSVVVKKFEYSDDKISKIDENAGNYQDLRLKGMNEKFLSYDNSSSHEGSYYTAKELMYDDYLFKIQDRKTISYNKNQFPDDISYGSKAEDLKGQDSTDGVFDGVFSMPSLIFVDSAGYPTTYRDDERKRMAYFERHFTNAFEDYFRAFDTEEEIDKEHVQNIIADTLDFEYKQFMVGGKYYTLYIPSYDEQYDENGRLIPDYSYEAEKEARDNNEHYFYRLSEKEYDEGKFELIKNFYIWEGLYKLEALQELDRKPQITRVEYGIERGYGTILEPRYDKAGKNTAVVESDWLQMNQIVIQANRDYNHKGINYNNAKQQYKGLAVIGYYIKNALTDFGDFADEMYRQVQSGDFWSSETFSIISKHKNIVGVMAVIAALFILTLMLVYSSADIAMLQLKKAVDKLLTVVINLAWYFGTDFIFIYGLIAMIQVNQFLNLFKVSSSYETLSIGVAIGLALKGLLLLYFTVLTPILHVYAYVQSYAIRIEILVDSAVAERFDPKKFKKMVLPIIAPSVVMFLYKLGFDVLYTFDIPFLLKIFADPILFIFVLGIVDVILDVPLIRLTKLTNTGIKKAGKSWSDMMDAGAKGTAYMGRNAANGSSASAGNTDLGSNGEQSNDATTNPSATGFSGTMNGIKSFNKKADMDSGKIDKNNITPEEKSYNRRVNANKATQVAKDTFRFGKTALGNASLGASGFLTAASGVGDVAAGDYKKGIDKMIKGTKEGIEDTVKALPRAGMEAVNNHNSRNGYSPLNEIQSGTDMRTSGIGKASVKNQGVELESKDGQMMVKVNPKAVRRQNAHNAMNYDHINKMAQTSQGRADAKAKYGVTAFGFNEKGDVTSFKMSAKSKVSKDGKEYSRNNLEYAFRRTTIDSGYDDNGQEIYVTKQGQDVKGMKFSSFPKFNEWDSFDSHMDKQRATRAPQEETKVDLEKKTGTDNKTNN